MTKNRIVKYATNTALLAVLAAAGIGAYQLGTSKPEENIQEEQEFVEMEQSTEEEPMVDVGTTEVEADMENTSGDLAGTEMEDGANGNEAEPLQEEIAAEENGQQPEDGTFAQSEENTVTDAAAGAVEAPVLNFSEETQMEWPVNGNILLDYNMDQTVYFPTLDQYKLSPAIAVQAAEGAPVLASVPGTV